MARVTIPSAGQYGVVSDSAPQELPPNAWTRAVNVRFRDGYAERFKGAANVFSAPTVAPYGLFPYASGATKMWVHAGAAQVFVDDGTTRTELTPGSPYTGTASDKWTGGTLGGVLVINNSVDVPQFWGGNVASDFAALTAWDSAWRCASIRPFKNYLVALDVTKSGTRYPHMVKWSHGADPGAIPATWDEADATKDAGEVDLAESSDLLVDQLALGDMNVIYKEQSMYAMRYIGQPFIWQFQRLPGDVGALARNCVANTPAGHVVLTAGDLVIHSGQGPKSLLTGRMRRWLFGQIDSTNFRRSFLAVNPPRNEVWVCFPQGGDSACTLALVWNWVDDSFGVRELPNVTCGAAGQITTTASSTWASDSEGWYVDGTSWNTDEYNALESRLILGGTGPSLQLQDTGVLYSGVAPNAVLERTGLTLDAPDMVKTIRSIVPRIDAATGTVLSIQVGASMDAETLPIWGGAVPYTVGTTRKADCFASGRFLSVRFSSSSEQVWRLKSYDLDVVQRGGY